jgi:hypothetical protein
VKHNSSIQSGRTIAERREKLETASERAETHKRNRTKQILRVTFTVVGFVAAALGIVRLAILFFTPDGANPDPDVVTVTPKPTIEVIDEATGNSGSLTTKMKEYIGQAEIDFRDLGFNPVKAVIPQGAVREVDFYLEGYNGYIKMTTDRGTAVSVEDADRMIHYLKVLAKINEFTYIDVRIEGKAYWK